MRLRLVSAVIGQLLRLFCVAFVPPLLLAAWDTDWWSALGFAGAGAVGAAFGTLLSWGYTRPRLFHRAEAMAVVAGTWLVVAAFAGVPYLFAGLGWADAFFESMSGLTTTGATILADFSPYGRSFFLWRAMTQWFGGLGVIALFVVILPRIGIAGRQLFFAESSSAPGEDVSPKIRQGASKLWVLYVALTVLCGLGLFASGLGVYDSVVHALTTLAAGGFSPNGSSIAGYANPAVEWTLVPFMFLAGASFPLQVRVFTGAAPKGFLRDQEFVFYAAIAAASTLLLSVILADGAPGLEALRAASFQVTSLMSSTGFASTDYNLWPGSAKMVLLLVMVVGGCAGSAAGGPKAVRHLLVGRHLLREVRQTLHPRAVLPLRYNGRAVSHPVMRAVFALAVLYVGGYFVVGVLLVWMGLPMVAAFTASLACLGNIGPGFDAVGPMGSFAGLSVGAKVLLTGAMWVGRLEILTVIALLHPDVWRSIRLGRRRPDEDRSPRRMRTPLW